MPAPSPYLRYARYGALAYELSGTILGGVFVGWLLDRWLGTQPYLALVCTMVAVVGGFVRLVTLLRRLSRNDGEPDA